MPNLHALDQILLVVTKYIFFIKTFHFELKNCVGRKQSASLFWMSNISYQNLQWIVKIYNENTTVVWSTLVCTANLCRLTGAIFLEMLRYITKTIVLPLGWCFESNRLSKLSEWSYRRQKKRSYLKTRYLWLFCYFFLLFRSFFSFSVSFLFFFQLFGKFYSKSLEFEESSWNLIKDTTSVHKD